MVNTFTHKLVFIYSFINSHTFTEIYYAHKKRYRDKYLGRK